MTTSEITTCQVLNNHDNIFLTLCTEWQDSSIKLTIFLPESSSPLIGEMKLTDVDKFAKDLSKTREEYMKMTRMILSGKDSSVEFILKDLKFRWKKGTWFHGMIGMFESKLEEVFPTVLKQLIDRHSEMEKTMGKIKIENNELRELQDRLHDKIEKMITLKNELEEDLYRKFIVVLNSKKDKIRQLISEVDKIKAGNTSESHSKANEIYEADTEEEEDSENVEDIVLKKNSTKKMNKKTNKLTKTQTGNIINADLFLSRNSASGNQKFREEEDEGGIKLLKRQISSDSEGKMIDSDYEEDRGGKRMNKNAKLAITPKTKSRFKLKAKSSKTDDEIFMKTEDEEQKIDEARVKLVGIGNNVRKSLLNPESEESEGDMFA